MKIQYLINKSITVRQWFREYYPNISYNLLQKHVRVKDVTVNGKKISPQHTLNVGDTIFVWDKIPKHVLEHNYDVPSWDDNKVIWEDSNLIVIDKPSGIPTQGHQHDSVFLRLQNRMITKNKRVFTVHRLDKETSGVLVFALNRETAMQFSQSIKKWNKIYTGIVPYNTLSDGRISTTESQDSLFESSIQRQILANRQNNHNMHKTQFGDKYNKASINQSNDKISETFYKHVANCNQEFSIMEFRISTGRKHQIRKHAAQLGYPIIGDIKYGSTYDINMQLHCKQLDIEYDGKIMSFKSNYPEHMKRFIDKCNIKM